MGITTNIELLMHYANFHHAVKCHTHVDGVLQIAALAIAVAVVFLKLDKDHSNEFIGDIIKLEAVKAETDGFPFDFNNLHSSIKNALNNKSIDLKEHNEFHFVEMAQLCILLGIKFGSHFSYHDIYLVEARKIKTKADERVKDVSFIEKIKTILAFYLAFCVIIFVILSYFSIFHVCLPYNYEYVIMHCIYSAYILLFFGVIYTAHKSKTTKAMQAMAEFKNKLAKEEFLVERDRLVSFVNDKVDQMAKRFVANASLQT